jgi:hypothetical protein
LEEEEVFGCRTDSGGSPLRRKNDAQAECSYSTLGEHSALWHLSLRYQGQQISRVIRLNANVCLGMEMVL